MPLTPNNREEHWLQGMVDGQTTLEPNKRREYWYKEIVDAIGSGGGGGDGGVLVVEQGLELPPSLSETWQTIYDAMASGKLVVISDADEYGAFHSYITEASINGDDYMIFTNFANDNPTYIASSADGYPVLHP